VQQLKKRKKSCFFYFQKKRKNARIVSQARHLITQPLITQLPGQILISHGHQHQTSCSEVRTQETMQLRTVCDKHV